MANKEKVTQSEPKYQKVVNITAHRLELVFDDKVYVFLPNQPVKVPVKYQIPTNIGLMIR